MARIRTIKPEFWTSAQVMECSTNARLMFIGMWNFADDHGRMAFSAKTIKAQIFPSDDISTENILGMLAELATNDLIRTYVVDGKEYLLITGWQHQRIDKVQKAKHPDPPKDGSGNGPGTFLARATPILKEKEDTVDGAAANGPASVSAYVFESGIIRLIKKDFDQWKKSFSHLDLAAELLTLTPWANEQGDRWFFAVCGALGKRNREIGLRKEQRKTDPEFKWNGIEGVV